MEIIGTNQEEKNKKTKKTMMWITIAIIILFVVSIILFISIYYLEQQQFKFFVDGKKIAKTTNDLFLFEGETVYVSLEDISSIINYKYYNGGYKQYSEDMERCYLESTNEICTFERDSNKIYKTPTGNINYEYFTINKPVKRMNGKLYITSEALKLACNLQFYYEPEKNTITINTLPYLAKYYTTNYKYSAVSESFKNQKALLYNLLIIQNVENTEQYSRGAKYGIYNLKDQKEIVGTKYTNIEFIESTGEFIVTTEEKKVGIITSDGETKVRPQYDALKQIDKDLNLYLATNGGKKGVIERNGKILIYLEYDEIGIDTTQFQNNDIKNSYLLFNNVIPVKQEGKWGMYDKKGNLILPIEYDGIGCIADGKNLNNILVIPEVKGIVVSKIYEIEKNRKVAYYGLVNSLGKELIATGLETIYSVTNNGREEYTMIYKGTSKNVIEYINENVDLEALSEENKTTPQANEKTNTLTNEKTNEIVTNQI